MKPTRRDFLTTAATVAGAAAAGNLAHAQEHGHEHDHQVVPSDVALRVKSLESLLVEKGLVDRAALDALIDGYEHKIGPRNGARVIARAWVDPAYKKRLLADASAAIALSSARFAPAIPGRSLVCPRYGTSLLPIVPAW